MSISVQSLVQFDSDHVLDVHTARMYPFDTYTLSTTVRALSISNRTLPLRRLVAITTTSSFDIETVDTGSYSAFNNTQNPSRDMNLRIRRPCVARALTLLLFVGAWILAHLTLGLVIIARRLAEVRSILKYLFVASIIFVSIPQVRNSMPDAPGLDGKHSNRYFIVHTHEFIVGILIGTLLYYDMCTSLFTNLSDCIGFFPQMVLTGFSVIALLLMVISRELDNTRIGQVHSTPLAEPTPADNSYLSEISQHSKHFRSQYLCPPPHRMCPGGHHYRSKTMSRTMEAGEMADSVD
jgi:hypothetical protein